MEQTERLVGSKTIHSARRRLGQLACCRLAEETSKERSSKQRASRMTRIEKSICSRFQRCSKKLRVCRVPKTRGDLPNQTIPAQTLLRPTQSALPKTRLLA